MKTVKNFFISEAGFKFISKITIYIHFARLSFQKQMHYRVANWAGLFTNIFFLFFRTSLFQSIYSEFHSTQSLNLQQILSYLCITQAILAVIPQWGFLGVDEDIRSGQITIHLSRPVNYYFSTLWQRIGTSWFFFIFRTLPILLMSFILNFLSPPLNFFNIILFLISVFLGSWIAISFHFIIELSAFWIESSRGIKIFFLGIINFFSGLTLPLIFFPEFLKKVSKLLPFEYMLNTPTLIYIGQEKNEIFMILGQFLWAFVFSIVAIILLRFGERKVILQGG